MAFLDKLFGKKGQEKKALPGARLAKQAAEEAATACANCGRRLLSHSPCPFCVPQHFGDELPEGTVAGDYEGASRPVQMGGVIVAFHAATEHDARGFLYVYEGGNKGATVLIGDLRPITIGRNPHVNSFALNDKRVSTTHCEIAFRAGGLVVIDKGAKNGIFLNDERIVESAPLASGDTLAMGSTRIYVGLVG
ncbi:MAG: FHA domain-containing protein [Planctomycetota bacterium]